MRLRSSFLGVFACALLGCSGASPPLSYTPFAELPFTRDALGPIRIGMALAEVPPSLGCEEHASDSLDCAFTLAARPVTAHLGFGPSDHGVTLRLARVHWLRSTDRAVVYGEAKRLVVALGEHGWIRSTDRDRLIGYAEEGATASPGSPRFLGSGFEVMIYEGIRVTLSVTSTDPKTGEPTAEHQLDIELSPYIGSGPTWG
jgi:hypothetical protein